MRAVDFSAKRHIWNDGRMTSAQAQISRIPRISKTPKKFKGFRAFRGSNTNIILRPNLTGHPSRFCHVAAMLSAIKIHSGMLPCVLAVSASLTALLVLLAAAHGQGAFGLALGFFLPVGLVYVSLGSLRMTSSTRCRRLVASASP